MGKQYFTSFLFKKALITSYIWIEYIINNHAHIRLLCMLEYILLYSASVPSKFLGLEQYEITSDI